MKKLSGEPGSFIGDFYPEFEQFFGQSFQQKFGVPKIQISVIKADGAIDVSPYLKLK